MEIKRDTPCVNCQFVNKTLEELAPACEGDVLKATMLCIESWCLDGKNPNDLICKGFTDSVRDARRRHGK